MNRIPLSFTGTFNIASLSRGFCLEGAFVSRVLLSRGAFVQGARGAFVSKGLLSRGAFRGAC